jgi:hypothetical protein
MFSLEFENNFCAALGERVASGILEFRWLVFMNNANNNAPQNMGRLSSFGVSP